MRLRIFLAIVMVCAMAGFSCPALAKDYIYAPVVNALEIIDCETDTVAETLPVYNDYIVGSGFSSDGKRYYLNAQHSVYEIDTATNKLVEIHKFSSELSKVTVLGFAISEDGKKLYLSCSIVKKKQNIPKLNVLPPQLVVYDIKAKKLVKNYPIPYCVTGVITLRKDPNHLILWGLDIHKLSLKNGKLEKIKGILNAEDGNPKNSLVIWHNGSPGDHGIFSNPYYTATGMGYIFIDRNTGKVTDLKAKDVWFEYSTIISPDKKYLYGVMDELVKIDMKTGETVKSVSVKRGTCYALSMTADGKKIYLGPAGPDISVYDTETLELLGVIPLYGDGVVAHRVSK